MKAAVRIAALSLCALLATPAAAQWAWRDDNGRFVYSDRPPPASVKANQIVRQPGGSSVVAVPAPGAAPSAPPTAAPSERATESSEAKPAGPKTWAERDMEFRKRQQERADAEKKAAEETARSAQRAQECERSRGYLRALEDGMRIQRTDAQGNREFLDDEGRNREVARMRELIAKNCS
jgi:DNA polymerase III gamma/tau subunit